ncbi:hypothetical protein [Breoghania sp.]|uniref:hypothetical protein n=1 Tax=Breoghania sp. TaxID=2065378 RepID=UPI002AA7B3AE|nr:hypothetical protein [Breoghania sp.]
MSALFRAAGLGLVFGLAAASGPATAGELSIPPDASNLEVSNAIRRSIVDYAARGDLDGLNEYAYQDYEEIKKTDKIYADNWPTKYKRIKTFIVYGSKEIIADHIHDVDESSDTITIETFDLKSSKSVSHIFITEDHDNPGIYMHLYRLSGEGKGHFVIMRYDGHCREGEDVALMMPHKGNYEFLIAEAEQIDLNGVIDHLKRGGPVGIWSTIDEYGVLENLAELVLNMPTTYKELEEDPVVTWYGADTKHVCGPLQKVGQAIYDKNQEMDLKSKMALMAGSSSRFFLK